VCAYETRRRFAILPQARLSQDNPDKKSETALFEKHAGLIGKHRSILRIK
jgi:hypothetical protein